jgi:hypothetical protein
LVFDEIVASYEVNIVVVEKQGPNKNRLKVEYIAKVFNSAWQLSFENMSTR